MDQGGVVESFRYANISVDRNCGSLYTNYETGRESRSKYCVTSFGETGALR